MWNPGKIGLNTNYATEGINPNLLPLEFQYPQSNTKNVDVNWGDIDFYRQQWQRGNNAILSDFFDE